MIPRSHYIAAICVGLAGTLHAAIAVLPPAEPERITIQGGGGASISALGDSFADMAEGVSVPEPEATTMPEPTKTSVPKAETTETEAPKPARSQASEARTMAALAPLQKSAAPAPVSAQPAEQALAPSPNPVDRIVAETETQAPVRSLRPQARPDRPKPKRQAASTPKQSGNANRSARAGDASGQEKAQQRRAGSTQSATTQAGNAAAANYPGKVMRRIQRTKRERVNTRGSARVSFTIAANGALAAVGIARSSGSASLDQVALQQIRRAAPFPPPPTGARRNFTLRIDGK